MSLLRLLKTSFLLPLRRRVPTVASARRRDPPGETHAAWHFGRLAAAVHINKVAHAALPQKARSMPGHRASEFLRCLRRVDWAVKKTRNIRLVLGNYVTHKTPEVQAWLDKSPRFKLSALSGPRKSRCRRISYAIHPTAERLWDF